MWHEWWATSSIVRKKKKNNEKNPHIIIYIITHITKVHYNSVSSTRMHQSQTVTLFPPTSPPSTSSITGHHKQHSVKISNFVQIWKVCQWISDTVQESGMFRALSNKTAYPLSRIRNSLCSEGSCLSGLMTTTPLNIAPSLYRLGIQVRG